MRAFRPKTSGFTLIELMIVLVIIALLAGMALAEFASRAPRDRLIGDSRELFDMLQKARVQAIRDSRLVKACFFKDSTPTDATPGMRYAILECNDKGNNGCGGTSSACLNTQSDGSGPFDQNWDKNIACGTNDGKWCPVSPLINGASTAPIDLTTLMHAPDHVSINDFQLPGPLPRASLGSNLLEITYKSDGTVAPSPYSNLQSGYIALTNFDMCTPSIGTCTAFKNEFYVQFLLGGPVRLTEQ